MRTVLALLLGALLFVGAYALVRCLEGRPVQLRALDVASLRATLFALVGLQTVAFVVGGLTGCTLAPWRWLWLAMGIAFTLWLGCEIDARMSHRGVFRALAGSLGWVVVWAVWAVSTARVLRPRSGGTTAGLLVFAAPVLVLLARGSIRTGTERGFLWMVGVLFTLGAIAWMTVRPRPRPEPAE
jgi:hypothetical protein